MAKIIYWTARVLAVLITVFWFVVTVVYNWGDINSMLLMSISWVVLLIITQVAWRKPVYGAIFFTFLGVLYIILARSLPLVTHFLVAVPFIVTGIVFYLDYRRKKK